jgi:hypothetical protein
MFVRADPTSVYTALEGSACKTISTDEETGDRTTSCLGAAGFALLVVESDDRASITIVTPNKRELPLNFWEFATPGFSTLGPRVEWRVATRRGKRIPTALIVQIDTVDQSDVTHPKPMSLLAVARVGESTACLTAKIPVKQPDARVQAQRAADDASLACLRPLVEN